MTVEGTVYLDHAGTTALDLKVLEAMIPYFNEHFGNPSSLHTCLLYTSDAADE